MILKVEIQIDDAEYASLVELGRAFCGPQQTPHEMAVYTVQYLVHSAADGVRRPGSWERGWLAYAFPSTAIACAAVARVVAEDKDNT